MHWLLFNSKVSFCKQYILWHVNLSALWFVRILLTGLLSAYTQAHLKFIVKLRLFFISLNNSHLCERILCTLAHEYTSQRMYTYAIVSYLLKLIELANNQITSPCLRKILTNRDRRPTQIKWFNSIIQLHFPPVTMNYQMCMYIPNQVHVYRLCIKNT